MNFVCRHGSGVIDFIFCVHPAGIDACVIPAQNIGGKRIPDDEHIRWRKVRGFFKTVVEKGFHGLAAANFTGNENILEIRGKPGIPQAFVLGFCGAVGDDV